MKKKILAITMVGVLAFAMMACGKQSDEPTTDTTANTEVTQAGTEETDETLESTDETTEDTTTESTEDTATEVNPDALMVSTADGSKSMTLTNYDSITGLQTHAIDTEGSTVIEGKNIPTIFLGTVDYAATCFFNEHSDVASFYDAMANTYTDPQGRTWKITMLDDAYEEVTTGVTYANIMYDFEGKYAAITIMAPDGMSDTEIQVIYDQITGFMEFR